MILICFSFDIGFVNTQCKSRVSLSGKGNHGKRNNPILSKPCYISYAVWAFNNVPDRKIFRGIS